MLCQLSYARLVRATGLEPVTTRLAVEGTPACAAGRLNGRPGYQAAKDAVTHPFGGEPGASRAAGIAPATVRSHDPKEPSPAQQADHFDCQGARTAGIVRAARPGVEPGLPASVAGVVPFPPPRIGLDGETRTPNLRLPMPRAANCATSRCPRAIDARTDGGARTHIGGGLARASTELGYVSVDRAGLEPATFSLQGSCASFCATGPSSRGGDRTRSRRRMRPAHLPESPLRCDRPDSNRLPPGPHPGVSSTSDLGHRRRGGSRTPVASL